MPHDALPPDPFAEDPEDPAKAMVEPEEDHEHPEMGDEERAELVGDLSDLAVYQALLEPSGVRGIVVDCGGRGVRFRDTVYRKRTLQG